MDWEEMLSSFWCQFGDVFLMFFQGVFRSLFLEPKRATPLPYGAILGFPGRGKGRGKPSPGAESYKSHKCCVCYFPIFLKNDSSKR